MEGEEEEEEGEEKKRGKGKKKRKRRKKLERIVPGLLVCLSFLCLFSCARYFDLIFSLGFFHSTRWQIILAGHAIDFSSL